MGYPKPIPTPAGMLEPGMRQRRRHTKRYSLKNIHFMPLALSEFSGQVSGTYNILSDQSL
jgi:hypothetical protein